MKKPSGVRGTVTGTVTEFFDKTGKVLDKHVSELVDATGRVGALLLGFAITIVVYIKLFPDLNEELTPLLKSRYPNSSLKPSSIIIASSLLSLFVFFLIALFRLFIDGLSIFCRFANAIIRYSVSQLVGVLQKLLFVIDKRYARELSKFLYFYRSDIYFNKFWLAKSESVGEKLRVPIKAAGFKYAECEINVVEAREDHWRAGVIFEGPERQEYIFHVYEDFTEPGALKSRIVLRVPGQEVEDRRDELTEIKEIKKVYLEVKKRNNKLAFLVNGRIINSFEVPLNTITNLYFAAWADDRPFTVEFRNIEVSA